MFDFTSCGESSLLHALLCYAIQITPLYMQMDIILQAHSNVNIGYHTCTSFLVRCINATESQIPPC